MPTYTFIGRSQAKKIRAREIRTGKQVKPSEYAQVIREEPTPRPKIIKPSEYAQVIREEPTPRPKIIKPSITKTKGEIIKQKQAELQRITKRYRAKRKIFERHAGITPSRLPWAKRVKTPSRLHWDRRVKTTPEKLGITEKLTLTERADNLISDIKRKGSTPELKKQRKSLLKEIVREERKAKKGIETVSLIGKRRELIRTEKPSLKREAKLVALTVATSLIGTGLGVKELVTHPIRSVKAIPKIPVALKEEAKEIGHLIRVSPTEAIAKIGAEVLILVGAGKVFKIVGKAGGKLATKLSPKFKGVNPKIITFGKGAKRTVIKMGRTVKKLAEPLKKQVEIAGKKVLAVSAQADRLVKIIRIKRIIRKPIQREKLLKSKTKSLLKKFDKGKISPKELTILERKIREEIGESLLERSFFADPRGRFRPSRLGKAPKDASLLDFLKGDVTFRSPKPQILVFEKVKVQAFPKTKIFNKIKNKLKAGKTLTKKEADALLKFQLKPTRKFKPIGHLTPEPEITLAPGEIVRRGKVVARVIINDRPVEIVKATVVKAKPLTKKLLAKAKTGRLTSKELKILTKNLKRETGFKPRLSRGKIGKKVIRERPLPRVRPRVKPRAKVRPRVKPRPKVRPRVKPRPKVRPRLKPRPKVRPRLKSRPKVRPRLKSRPKVRPRLKPRPKVRPRARPKVRPRRVPGPRPRPPIRPLLKRIKKRIPKRKKVKPQAYSVWARPLKRTKKGKKPKLIKVNKVPLTKKGAKDLRNYIVDQSLGRTARIKPIRGKPSTPKLKVPKGYARKTYGKFRRYRIKKGKRIPLKKGRVIEKRSYLLDTKYETKQITLRRRIAQLSKPLKRKPIPKKQRRKASTSGGIFGTPSRRVTPKKRVTPKRKTIKKKRPIRRDRGIFG